MPQDQLRLAIDALRARLQDELEAQLTSLTECQGEALEAARRGAEAEAEQRWAAKVEAVRAEWVARLESEVSAARAEAERRFVAEAARMRAEADQAAAQAAARARTEAEQAAAQAAARARIEAEQAAAQAAARASAEAEQAAAQAAARARAEAEQAAAQAAVRASAEAEQAAAQMAARVRAEAEQAAARTVAAVRAEAEQAAAQAAARARGEAEQAAAQTIARARADAEQANAQMVARVCAEAERAAAHSAARVREEAEQELEGERQRVLALLDSERERASADLDAERQRAAALLDAERQRVESERQAERQRAEADRMAERQRFETERQQFRADRQRFEVERQQFLIERDRRDKEAQQYEAARQRSEQLDADRGRLEAELTAERERVRQLNDALRQANDAMRHAEGALEHERQTRASDEALRAQSAVALGAVTEARAAERDSQLALVERLLGGMRAMDAADSLTGILTALVEAAGVEAPRAALFIANGQHLQGLKAVGFPGDGIGSQRLAVGGAGLLTQVMQRGEAIPASQDSGAEVPAFAALPPGRAAIAVPIVVGGQAVAVLYADDGGADATPAPASWPEAVQILGSHAAACLSHVTAARTAQAMRLAAGTPPSDDESSAKRYARLLVSEIKLYNEAAVRVGRENRDLLYRLRPEIERARRLYEERIPAGAGVRGAYFHQELVQTLADGDPALLGGPA